MKNPIKIILSILLFLCLLKMPYSYYQLVRFTATIGFLYLGSLANKEKRRYEIIAYLVLALLFQPFFKIALGRTIWNIVDVIVGLGLIISLWKSESGQNEIIERKSDKMPKKNSNN